MQGDKIANKYVYKKQHSNIYHFVVFVLLSLPISGARGKRCEFPAAHLPMCQGNITLELCLQASCCSCSHPLDGPWPWILFLSPAQSCWDAARLCLVSDDAASDLVVLSFQLCLLPGADLLLLLPKNMLFPVTSIWVNYQDQGTGWALALGSLQCSIFSLVHGPVLAGAHLRSVCGCGHGLVVCMNHGPFPMAFLEELILGSNGILARWV